MAGGLLFSLATVGSILASWLVLKIVFQLLKENLER